MAVIKAISISDRKGIRKKNINSTRLLPGFGLENDAHGGKWHRQVSFLAQESIETMREKGLDVVAGNFAENITTEGLDLMTLAVGDHLRIGESELVISQLGKICHTRCAIYHQAGDCVMPREGIFAVITKGGEIEVNDHIELTQHTSQSVGIVSTKELIMSEGEQLEQLVTKKFAEISPAFIRVDTISNKEGGSFDAILEDLTQTQKITKIVVIDPSGGFGLSLAGLPKSDNDASCFHKEDSTIYYFRSTEDLNTSISESQS